MELLENILVVPQLLPRPLHEQDQRRHQLDNLDLLVLRQDRVELQRTKYFADCCPTLIPGMGMQMCGPERSTDATPTVQLGLCLC